MMRQVEIGLKRLFITEMIEMDSGIQLLSKERNNKELASSIERLAGLYKEVTQRPAISSLIYLFLTSRASTTATSQLTTLMFFLFCIE